MDAIHIVATMLERAFPYYRIDVCEGSDYPIPVVLVCARLREPLGWSEVVTIHFEDGKAKVSAFLISRPFEHLAVFDLADPSFDPNLITVTVREFVRNHQRFSKIVDGYMGRKGKRQDKKRKRK